MTLGVKFGKRRQLPELILEDFHMDMHPYTTSIELFDYHPKQGIDGFYRNEVYEQLASS